jgi:hypothetical protein
MCGDSLPYDLARRDVRDNICAGRRQSTREANITFYHIPKTGGESLENALGIRKNHDVWWLRNETDHVAVTVTVVRNPYDRMLSWFRFCLHGWHGILPGPPKHCLRAHSCINEHGRGGQNHTVDTVSQAFEDWLSEIYLNPQFWHPWVTSNYEEFLGGYKPLHVDFIIRFEHYSEDYALLARGLGFEKTELPHKNGAKNATAGSIDPRREKRTTFNPEVAKLLDTDYHNVYSERARSLIEMKYASDLKMFNYTF